ncbi:MAG: hypothetical protein PHZ11_10085 [Desulfitobacteriaceae bacterium]|nr:hypothetical protein [Desulfitobacteriaceae bacterium]MDD4347205.1 hypothetical protein [Desulfitobacteriaceae bacterium]MDD4401798.1 hypothetical protein [Desulfitobacteriaceae bacterium]
MRADSAKHIAKGKGVHREVESEGSRRQTSGLTNRNHIRQCKLGKVAKQTEALNYPETYDVNVADRWKERLRSYPGRSHGRMETK